MSSALPCAAALWTRSGTPRYTGGAMNTFSGRTDIVHQNPIPATVRAYFSATGVRLREDVWLRVETRWVGNGTPVKITLIREDEGEGQETLKEIDGRITDDLFEQQWHVELPKSRLDEVHGPIHLYFDAK